jgi:hypothetical protein
MTPTALAFVSSLWSARRVLLDPTGMPVYKLRPSLYRSMRVVLSDGSTFRVPAAIRTVGNTLLLERDPVNHPVYQVRHCRHSCAPQHRSPSPAHPRPCNFPPQGLGDQANLTTRREEARLQRLRDRSRQKVFEE